eukprot:TRINITY_DN61421_c0_g1_i1.p1 TRINITY_DN61421_c0_g1~~TRINITY_DN61421_c0_g1_i1.p1  ORF type:complete len:286 (-),score=50.40 TRINITY_DN61421_c0_g1_i1:105-857(-)
MATVAAATTTAVPRASTAALRSVGGSLAAFGTFVGTSACADQWTTPERANAIGLAFGAALNFLLQRRAFGANLLAECKGGPRATVLRYALAEAVIVGSQQGLFVLGVRKFNLGNSHCVDVAGGFSAPAIGEHDFLAWDGPSTLNHAQQLPQHAHPATATMAANEASSTPLLASANVHQSPAELATAPQHAEPSLQLDSPVRGSVGTAVDWVRSVGLEETKLLLALRVASQATVFAVVSFPLRRHWVFARR